jgi:hypothetical protein
MPCSADTGAYCTARSNLPEQVLHGLMRDAGKQVEDESPERWLWHGRKVRVVDGSTVTMPDTFTLREVRICVAQKGFRTRSLVVVTTLLDAEQYPPEDIALLYRRRTAGRR